MSDDPISILLVDDEEDFLEMLSMRLEAMGNQVATATSGQACLDHLAQSPAEVVVLDLKMPGMDGLETLKQIKANHPKVEVIMMTGHGAVESANQGKALGAFDYMLKPADFDELLDKLAKARDKARQ